MRRMLVLTVAAALAAPTAAGGSVSYVGSSPIVSPHGVGGVLLGATVKSLHRKHLIGRLHPGCELDPGQRVAPLRRPLRGFAVFSHPRDRVSAITVTAGAETAKGVGIGDTPHAARQAYPHAQYDPPGTNSPFLEGFVWVNNAERPKMTFVVSATSHRISELSVPAPNFCE